MEKVRGIDFGGDGRKRERKERRGERRGIWLMEGREEKEREIGLKNRQRKKGILDWREKERGRRGREKVAKVGECPPPKFLAKLHLF